MAEASSSAGSISSIYTVHPPLNCTIDLGLGHGGFGIRVRRGRGRGRGWGREAGGGESVRVQTGGEEEAGENKDTVEEVSPGCLSCQFPLI